MKSTDLNDDREKVAAQKHCRKIKAVYKLTKGNKANKRKGYTNIPLEFWEVLEEMLNDKAISTASNVKLYEKQNEKRD